MTLDKSKMGNGQPDRDVFGWCSHYLGHKEWSSLRILDFGSGVGTFALSSNGLITPENYYCIEVDQKKIERGTKLLPRSHWYKSDNWSFCYNRYGSVDAEFPISQIQFDLIVAVGVFPTLSFDLIQKLFNQIFPHLLAKNGQIIFSFWEPLVLEAFLNYRLQKGHLHINKRRILTAANSLEKFYLVNDERIFDESTKIESIQLEAHNCLVNFISRLRLKDLCPKVNIFEKNEILPRNSCGIING